MTYVKINGNLYPATLYGRSKDRDWDDRESKSVVLENMDYATASTLFVDGLSWSTIQRVEVPVYQKDEEGNYVFDEEGERIQIGTEFKDTEWNNDEYSIIGDITVHRSGAVTVKVGKLTELEEAYEILFGGII